MNKTMIDKKHPTEIVYQMTCFPGLLGLWPNQPVKSGPCLLPKSLPGIIFLGSFQLATASYPLVI